MFLRFGFIYHYLTLIWLAINGVIFLPNWDCFAHDGNRWMIFSCHYLDPWVLSYFSPMFSWGVERWSSLGGHLMYNQGQSTTITNFSSFMHSLKNIDIFHTVTLACQGCIYICYWAWNGPAGWNIWFYRSVLPEWAFCDKLLICERLSPNAERYFQWQLLLSVQNLRQKIGCCQTFNRFWLFPWAKLQ